MSISSLLKTIREYNRYLFVNKKMHYFFTAQKYILYVYYANKKLNFFRNPAAYFAASLAFLAIAEANTKSLSSGLSACRISSLVPSHHLRPS